jgi:hypothetical protein
MRLLEGIGMRLLMTMLVIVTAVLFSLPDNYNFYPMLIGTSQVREDVHIFLIHFS